jgi:signal transduction histidine kinase
VQAVQRAGALRPDLVLMDVRLSGTMDGIEAADEIRARFDIPVVFLTAHSDERTLERVKQTRPFGYLLKPFRPRELQTAIEMALYEHRAEVEIREHNRKLLALQAAGTAIASSLDLDDVLETVTREMADLLEAEACTAYEWHADTGGISLLAQYSNNGRHAAGSWAAFYRLADDSTAKNVLLEKEPLQLRIGQPDLEPITLSHMHAIEAQTLLVLPMVFRDRVMGIVEIIESVERTFTENEISVACLLANQAASALENAQLYEQVRERLEELTALNSIGQAITSTLDLQEVLSIVSDHAMRLLGAAGASVALRDTDNGDLWFVAASGEAADSVRDRRLPLDHGIIGWVIRYGQGALVPDATQDARFYSGFDEETGFTTCSILCVPLDIKGQTIGAIEVLNKANGAFDRDDLRLLSSLAAPAATAIENARLYSRAQQEISERKRAEAALVEERASLAQRVAERTVELREANVELEEAARAKDRFVSHASHELRTPLSVLTLLARNLERFYDRWDQDQRCKTIDDIRGQTRLLSDLVQSVLDISRIDCKRVSTARAPVDLARLAREESDRQKLLAVEREQTLRIAGVEQLVLSGNESQLRQVVRNLVNNALKYTPVGGKITIECQMMTEGEPPESGWPGVTGLPAGRWAALRVVDTGIGIGPEALPRLFERFFRVNEQGNIPGVGLGLSIAKELVELHGGFIDVASTPGKSTVFAVYLPLSEE